MAQVTVTEIDAQIAALESVKTSRLTGKQIVQFGRGDRSGRFTEATIAEINGEIARLKSLRASMTGCASGNGPIRVGFGDRI